MELPEDPTSDSPRPTASNSSQSHKRALHGENASRRMHEYLMNQQRRKEEYWLRKYGKVLQPAPKPQTKPQRNSPPSLLPPIAHGPGGHRGAQRGQPAMFNAAGPIPSFPMQGALHDPDRRHKANIPYHSALPTQLPPLKHNPAPTSEGAMRAPLLPPISSTDGGSVGNNMGEDGLMLGPGREPSFSSSPTNNHSQGRTSPGPHDSLNDASMPQQPPHIQMLMQQQEKQAQESQSPEKSQRMSHASAGDAFKGSPPLHHSPNAAVVLHPFNLAGAAAAGHLPPLPKAHYSNIGPKVQAQNKPGRDLQLELAVLKAIKSREDVIDRLKVACDKLSTSLGGTAPLVLTPTDPLVRLLFRLVGQLRQRTLDAVEALAAWHRRTGSSTPFMYYGADYIAAIGPDLEFLDQQTFLRSRLHGAPRATEDPFLCHLTPDGIPLEEATTTDLRRGNMRFSSDALRIRMARKVLVAHGGVAGPRMESAGLSGFQPIGNMGPGDMMSESSMSSMQEDQYTALVARHNEVIAPFLDTPPDSGLRGGPSGFGEAERWEGAAPANDLVVESWGGPLQGSLEEEQAQERAVLESLSRSHAALSQELLQTAPGGSRDAYAGAAGEAGGSEASDSVAGRISLAGGTGVQEGQEEGEGAGQRRGEERVGEEGWEEASLAGEMSAAVVAPEAEAGVDGDAGADEQQEQDQDQEQEQHGDEVQEEGEDVDATARAALEEEAEMEGEEPFPLPDLGAAAASMAASVSQLSQSQTLMTSQSPRQPMLAGVPRSLFAVEPASLSQSQALSKSGLDQPAPGQASLLRDSSWQRNSQAVQLAVSGALDYDLDDGAFIDFAVDAMVASLEEPYVLQIPTNQFSVSGWEIDRQLDCLIDTLDPPTTPDQDGKKGGQAGAAAQLTQSMKQQTQQQHQRAHHVSAAPTTTSTAQIQLELHMSGDIVRTTILPGQRGLLPNTPPLSQAQPPLLLQSPSQAARPPTRQIHLRLRTENGVLKAQLVTSSGPISRQSSRQHTPMGNAGTVPGTGISLQGSPLGLSRDLGASSASLSMSQSLRAPPAMSSPVPAPRPGAAQVQLLLNVYGDEVAASIQPALLPAGYPSGAGGPQLSRSVSQQRPPTAQISLVLDIEGDTLRASLLPKGAGPGGAAGVRGSSPAVQRPTSQVQLVLEINTADATARAVGVMDNDASLGVGGGSDLGASGPISFSRSGSFLGTGSRPGTALVQLVLDISGEELSARLSPVRRGSPSIKGRGEGAGLGVHQVHRQQYEVSHGMEVLQEGEVEGVDDDQDQGSGQSPDQDLDLDQDQGGEELQVSGNQVFLRLDIDPETGEVHAGITPSNAAPAGHLSAGGDGAFPTTSLRPIMSDASFANATFFPLGQGSAMGMGDGVDGSSVDGQQRHPHDLLASKEFGAGRLSGSGSPGLAQHLLTSFHRPPSRPPTALVHLALHMDSEGVLHAGIVPAAPRSGASTPPLFTGPGVGGGRGSSGGDSSRRSRPASAAAPLPPAHEGEAEGVEVAEGSAAEEEPASIHAEESDQEPEAAVTATAASDEEAHMPPVLEVVPGSSPEGKGVSSRPLTPVDVGMRYSGDNVRLDVSPRKSVDAGQRTQASPAANELWQEEVEGQGGVQWRVADEDEDATPLMGSGEVTGAEDAERGGGGEEDAEAEEEGWEQGQAEEVEGAPALQLMAEDDDEVMLGESALE